MKRDSFLKMIGAGIAGGALIPEVLKAETTLKPNEKPQIAIDIRSISNMSIGGRRITAAEILDIYNQTGFLLYTSSWHGEQCNAPMVLNGEIKVIDVTKK